MDKFARGFQSPDQISQIRCAISFCLDATHGISARSMDIMYTLLIKSRITGTGYPVAYMVTNDHSVGPIMQWLGFLRQQAVFRPSYITIDFSLPEVNAIKQNFPGKIIHYCAFHVIQAWHRQLKAKVRVQGLTSTETSSLRNEMLLQLGSILRLRIQEAFQIAIQEFKDRYQQQRDFITYLSDNWLASEDIIGRWSSAFLDIEHHHMLTNNYIESWHNQGKTIWFKGQRNRRLDKLVFILTHSVQSYFDAEAERITMNSGRMGPIERDQAKRMLDARNVGVTRMTSMIINPSNNNNSNTAIQIGTWQVSSFQDNSIRYQVIVNDNRMIASCSCTDFVRRQYPCKHMYLLKRYTGIIVAFHTDVQNDDDDFEGITKTNEEMGI
jgi:hypothetical protein